MPTRQEALFAGWRESGPAAVGGKKLPMRLFFAERKNHSFSVRIGIGIWEVRLNIVNRSTRPLNRRRPTCNIGPCVPCSSTFSNRTQDSPIWLGRKGDRVANTPIRVLPPNRGRTDGLATNDPVSLGKTARSTRCGSIPPVREKRLDCGMAAQR